MSSDWIAELIRLMLILCGFPSLSGKRITDRARANVLHMTLDRFSEFHA
jgi:hypothetical protein